MQGPALGRKALPSPERTGPERRVRSFGRAERLLEQAYDRLRRGLTDPLDFPVSREAIRLFGEINTPATFGKIMAAGDALGCDSGETAKLLSELVAEGVLRRSSTSKKVATRPPATALSFKRIFP